MALSDPQLESRLKNIESTIEQRFASYELKINEFVEKLSSMLRTIENNDTSVKAEVKEKFDVQEGLKLGLKGIFIRDFKQYELETGLMGVSVSTGTIATLLSHFSTEAFGAACKAYVLEKKLGLFVMIAI